MRFQVWCLWNQKRSQFFEFPMLSFQLRLDFSSFVITGPSTATVSTVKLFSGLPSNSVGGAGVSAAEATQCLTDTFSVTNPGGNSPPQICGTNTNQHS